MSEAADNIYVELCVDSELFLHIILLRDKLYNILVMKFSSQSCIGSIFDFGNDI